MAGRNIYLLPLFDSVRSILRAPLLEIPSHYSGTGHYSTLQRPLLYIIMYLKLLLVALAASVVPSLAAPTQALEPRGASQCGQYTSISTGSYTVYANEWGSSTGTGSQCSQINGLTGNTLAWSTSWSWSGGPNNVKSYTNVESPMTSKPLTQYNSIKTNWTWRYVDRRHRTVPLPSNARILSLTPF